MGEKKQPPRCNRSPRVTLPFLRSQLKRDGAGVAFPNSRPRAPSNTFHLGPFFSLSLFSALHTLKKIDSVEFCLKFISREGATKLIRFSFLFLRSFSCESSKDLPKD